MVKKLIKVNLGCGPNGIDGWLNYDWGLLPLLNKLPVVINVLVKTGVLSKSYERNWSDFSLRDIRKELPHKNSSVDYVYCSHVLEHFEKWETESVLKEVRRILKKDGILRIVLPDIRKLISMYQTKGAEEFNRAWWGFEKDDAPNSLLKKLMRIFIRGHQWMYDDELLVKMLKEVGFNKIEKCKYRNGKTPDLDKLDLELHEELSIYYEARK